VTIREQSAGTDVVSPVQTVQLRQGALVARVADVPDFDTALVPDRVPDGHCTQYIPVVEVVDLVSSGVGGIPGPMRASRGKETGASGCLH
jgi:hypothetical protein